MSDTPLYDATLGSVLTRLRVQARLEAQAELDATVSRELDRVRREYDLRLALAAEQAEHLAQQRAEEAVRAALVSGAPVLVDLAAEPQQEAEVDEPTAPPVPPFSELLTSSKRLDSFFDALLGP